MALVRIEQFNREIDVDDESTILTAALSAGLDYPFLCQQGQCGACKSYLVSGSVDLGTFYNPMVLTDDERSRGLILACQARPLEDCVVAVSALGGDVNHTVCDLDCEVAEINRAASDITIVKLRNLTKRRLVFSAGQYGQLTLPNMPPREYSMANRPDEDILEFHVRHMRHGKVSPFVRDALALGDRVKFQGPFGSAYLREEHLGPILLGAGGSGLAPIQSILKTALAAGLKQRLFLYFGVRDTGRLYQVAALEELAREYRNLTLQIAISEPVGQTGYQNGRVSELIAADFSDLTDFHTYLAGPPAFCEAAGQIAVRLGADHVFSDPFVTAGKPGGVNETTS